MGEEWQKQPMKWSLIVPVNNQEVLATTLLRSPDLNGQCELILKRHHVNAASAFNEGIQQATGDVLVLAHQDVYFPERWWQDLEEEIRELEAVDPNWGVLGVAGVTQRRELRGYIYSTGLKGFVGTPFTGAREVATLDEVVLVLRRAAGLRFDDRLPGFHLYGADICLEAARRGMKSYAVPVFCMHNSVGVKMMPREFWDVYLYLRAKWRRRLPIPTCCTVITRFCTPMLRRAARDFYWKLMGGRRVGMRHKDPQQFFNELLATPARAMEEPEDGLAVQECKEGGL